MGALRESDRRGVQAAERALATVALDGPPTFAVVSSVVRDLIDLPRVLAFNVGADEGRGLYVDDMAGCNVPCQRFRERTDQSLAVHGTSWTSWNARRPERSQRNVALDVVQYLGWRKLETLPAYVEVLRPCGVPPHQVRMLVCEGESLVAWIGGFSDEAIPIAARRRLQALAPALRRRLVVAQRLGSASVTMAALDATLEEIPRPAMLVSAPCRILHANTAAKAWFARDRHVGRELVRACVVGGDDTMFASTRIGERGVPAHWLLVLHGQPPDASQRAAIWAKRYGLTARQATVLRHVVDGLPNREIAALLAVADITIEVHVSAILAKCDCRSRAELIARFWKA